MKLAYYNNHLASIARWNFNTLLSFVDSHIVSYPTPIALNYAWSFGSMAGLCLGIQILSGVFLAGLWFTFFFLSRFLFMFFFQWDNLKRFAWLFGDLFHCYLRKIKLPYLVWCKLKDKQKFSLDHYEKEFLVEFLKTYLKHVYALQKCYLTLNSWVNFSFCHLLAVHFFLVERLPHSSIFHFCFMCLAFLSIRRF